MLKGFATIVIIILIAIAVGLGGFTIFKYKIDNLKSSSLPSPSPNPTSSILPINFNKNASWETYNYKSQSWGYSFSFNYPNNWTISPGYQEVSPQVAAVQLNKLNKANIGGLSFASPDFDNKPQASIQTYYITQGTLSDEMDPLKVPSDDAIVKDFSKTDLTFPTTNAAKITYQVTFAGETHYYIEYFIQKVHIGVQISLLIPEDFWSNSQDSKIKAEELAKSFVLQVQ